ncbi:hypothetical protein SAMN02745857_04334 [Andreprevotia lacus DSM 23236]|jgi:hypothetical protein|uniref:Lipoprotein n=1 Tax=Andreprevotia lacus DSM 23236 TaxID=1121001 RepID=A0A1W1Y192_9NEIS|nr:hypothetical protein [Andreprevotia lacus]SMC29990.1 hypothetical protein SAMN02745857_04334 [Andreprevotia lacus DSM 23236]
MKTWCRIGILVLGSLLAACGGGSSGESSTAQQSQAQPPKAQAAPLRQVGAGTVIDSFSGTGFYWDPAQAGTGLMIEEQGSKAFLGLFVYDDQGNPVWYTATGDLPFLSGPSFSFNATLQSYRGGQPLDSSVSSVPVATNVGQISVTFSFDNTIGWKASAVLPGGRVMNAQRFQISPDKPITAANNARIERGWYWNASKSGRGWAVEVQGDQVFMVVFHYNADGTPTWNVANANIASGKVQTDLLAYRGGQTLTGSYKAPLAPVKVGQYTLDFPQDRTDCTGSATLNNLPAEALSKFAFAPNGLLCRQFFKLVNPQ